MDLSTLSYPARLALVAKRCDVPKRDGDRCVADKLPDEQFCSSHKVVVAKTVVRLLGGEL